VPALDEVGVPVITPVAVFIESPAGNEGEIKKAIGDVPPLAVTGVKAVAAIVAVSVSEAIAIVVVRAPETVSEKVFVALPAAESVTVTV
jgi:hypothetical protein